MTALFSGPEKTPFKMRGLHLDPCRHFIELETVLRIIDKMGALQLNTLHLHLSDDQSIPVEFACAPQITSPRRYSISDQERIAARCREHGIQVIPELDIPGHAKAFLSCFDPTIEPETRLGLITDEVADLERDLPVIFQMFEELVARFDASMIHMGGDEAPNFHRYPELIHRVCEWAAARGLEVIAWDDVLGHIDAIPQNLIIHRWRQWTSKKIHDARTILSWGYYLDRVNDPFTYYNRHPIPVGEPLGAIACMWTELVTDQTIERTIFPSLYMLANRWWSWPEKVENQPRLLHALCERFGHPEVEQDMHENWRTRRWIGFYKDDPRSTSSVTVHDRLDRDQDRYPTFSKALVQITNALYHLIQDDTPFSAETRSLFLAMGHDCYGVDLGFVLEQGRGWKKKIQTIIKSKPQNLYFNNGLEVAIRRAMRARATPSAKQHTKPLLK